MADLARFWPGLALAAGASLLLGGTWARRFRVSRPLGTATVLAIGLILAATLSPTGPLPDGSGLPTCDLSRLGLRSIAEYVDSSEAALNLALFLPLGAALGIHPRTGPWRIALLAALAMPVAIEVAQLLVPALGRYCDGMDVVDNVTGLVIGLLAGGGFRAVILLVARPSGQRGVERRSSTDA